MASRWRSAPKEHHRPSRRSCWPGRLIAGLYEGLLGIAPDEEREINAHMFEDHANEKVRDKDVTFKVKLLRLQERLLPE